LALDSDFFVTLGLKTKGFVDGFKKATDSVKGLSDKLGQTSQKASKFSVSARRDMIAYAGSADKARAALTKTFLAGVVGARALKLALLATGIGALVVALGAILTYWRDIKGLLTGVNKQLQEQLITVEKEVEAQEKKLAILNASDNVNKLAGKSQREINNLKIKETKTLLIQLSIQRDILRESLKGADKQQKIYKKVSDFLVDVLAAPFIGAAKGLELLQKASKIVVSSILVLFSKIAEFSDKYLGTDLADGVKKAFITLDNLELPKFGEKLKEYTKSLKDAIVPEDFLTGDIIKDLDKLDLKIAKTANIIAGLKLSNIEIGIKESAKDFDVEISNIKLAISDLNDVFRTAASPEEALEARKAIFAAELLLLKSQYEKKKLLAKGDADLLIIIENENTEAIKQAKSRNNAKIIALEKENYASQAVEAKKGTDKVTQTALEGLQLFAVQASQIITNNIGGAFNGIGEAIGSSLATGNNVINAIGGVLLDSIGKLTTQLGQAAIAVGIGMLSIKTAFTNPFSAIAAGVALVAIGAAISSAQDSVSGIGSGSSAGGASSSAGGGVSTSSPFSTSTSNGEGFEGRVVFEIAGDKLIGVLNNTSFGNLRVGNNDLIQTG
tara:strand:+ start:3443 stop:5284 length:1842 start_codon:yes stop_codon:yes gene_type:complete